MSAARQARDVETEVSCTRSAQTSPELMSIDHIRIHFIQLDLARGGGSCGELHLHMKRSPRFSIQFDLICLPFLLSLVIVTTSLVYFGVQETIVGDWVGMANE